MADVKLIVSGGGTKIFVNGKLNSTYLFEDEEFGRQIAEYTKAYHEFLESKNDGIAVFDRKVPEVPRKHVGFFERMIEKMLGY